MEKPKRLELYARALETWGELAQVEMLMEESIELALATRKFIRNKNDITFKKLAEEVADVEIMIEQTKLMFPSLEILTPNIKDSKLARLKLRLDNKDFEG